MTGPIFEVGEAGVSKPTILQRGPARFTDDARNNKVNGIVILSVIFAADGQITIEKVIQGLPLGLTENAMAAARKIRFNPATKDGKPINLRTTLEYSFDTYRR